MKNSIISLLNKDDVIRLLRGISDYITNEATAVIPRPLGNMVNDNWRWSEESLKQEDIKTLYQLYVKLCMLLQK